MAGGLLNLIAVGSQNIILNGNPKKTFFKATYAKYTNFGMQKFRLDFEGLRNMNMNEETKLTFKVKRYGDLLMDTYLVITLPHIWSPVYPPQDASGKWIPYEFKWIEDLGTQIIKEITFTCGHATLQKFTGDYLTAMVNRDFSNTKRDLYNEMTGNTKYFNDPGNHGTRNNTYPNAYVDSSRGGAEPSIRGRNLYIPINAWFTLSSKMAFPLISLQYNELNINITLRPVRELYTIRDVTDVCGNYPIMQPNMNNAKHQFYNFLQSPPDVSLSFTDDMKRTDWNSDIHLISTYGFLSTAESRVFASKPQDYLITEVYEKIFHNVSGSKRVELDSVGLVKDWLFFFRRSDANMRNQWSNYTNWPYKYVPQDIEFFSTLNNNTALQTYTVPSTTTIVNPSVNPDGTSTQLYGTGSFTVNNQNDILQTLGVLVDGKYRENLMHSGVYNYIEKYTRTSGAAVPGLYCYNFCINSSLKDIQPSGAMNLSKFNKIEYEFTTFEPSLATNVEYLQLCSRDASGNTIFVGYNKPSWQIYDYTYDLHVYEERYNVLTFASGNCGLMYAR